MSNPSLPALAALIAQWRKQAKYDAKHGVASALHSNREFFGLVNAAFVYQACADELEELLSAAPPSAEIAARVQAIREREQAATNGPWLYRPCDWDDWGYVRSPVNALGMSPIVARADSGNLHDDHDAHRKAKTDPYEANGRFIAHARADIPWLLNQLESALPVSRPTWRDIATAPKDGTRFIAWGPTMAVAECEWVRSAWYRSNQYPSVEPTHWMPLPDPPATAPKGGKL